MISKTDYDKHMAKIRAKEARESITWRKAMNVAKSVFPKEVWQTKEGYDHLGYLIWNFTGYPSFFHDNWRDEMRKQLEDVRDGRVIHDEYGMPTQASEQS